MRIKSAVKEIAALLLLHLPYNILIDLVFQQNLPVPVLPEGSGVCRSVLVGLLIIP